MLSASDMIVGTLAALVFLAYTFMVIATLFLEERVRFFEPAALFLRATRTGLLVFLGWSSVIISVVPVGAIALFLAGPAHGIATGLFFLLAAGAIMCWLWVYGTLFRIMHSIEYAVPIKLVRHITVGSGKLQVVTVKIG